MPSCSALASQEACNNNGIEMTQVDVWFSKMLKTIESATFGAEFVAMHTCIEHNCALRFKLQMFDSCSGSRTDKLEAMRQSAKYSVL